MPDLFAIPFLAITFAAGFIVSISNPWWGLAILIGSGSIFAYFDWSKL